MNDLSGEWYFKEELDNGHTEGSITFNQKGNKLFGTAILTEFENGDIPFEITQEIEGIVMHNDVTFKGVSFKITSTKKKCDYYLDSWEGTLNSTGQIVGSSIDKNGTCGVFIMKRIL